MEAISKTLTVENKKQIIMDSDAIDTVVKAFGVAHDELRWRENKDGVVYIGDDISPKLIARITITHDDECIVAIADSSDVGIVWEELNRI